jgi:hypothetical protein
MGKLEVDLRVQMLVELQGPSVATWQPISRERRLQCFGRYVMAIENSRIHHPQPPYAITPTKDNSPCTQSQPTNKLQQPPVNPWA